MIQKISLAILFLFLSLQITFAQKKVLLGIKGGLSSATFLNSSSLNYKNKNGYTGGLNSFFTFKSEKLKRFALMTELNFTQAGNKFTENSTKINHRLRYITLNLKPRYYIGMLGKAKSGIYLNGGPFAGYLLSATKSTISGDENLTVKVHNEFSPIDYGFDLGIGWSLVGMLSFDFNYHFGLAPIQKVRTKLNLRNNAFGVFMNLAIPIFSEKNSEQKLRKNELKNS